MNAGYAANRTSAEAKAWAASGESAISMSARKAMGDASAGSGILDRTRRAPPAPPPAIKAEGDSWEKSDANDAWSK